MTESLGSERDEEFEVQKGEEKVLQVETPIFIPHTKDSELKKDFQHVDTLIGEATATP